MTSKRYFFALLAIFVLLIGLIIGGAVGGNMILQKQSNKLTELKVENAAIELQQTALIQAKKDIERYSDLEGVLKSIVPQDKDQAKTVREIVQIAAANKIPIKSVSFEASTLGDAVPKGSAQKQLPVSQVKPLEGITGVYSLPVAVESADKVGYQDFLNFLSDLETNRRTAHVEAIDITPSENGKSVEFTLTLNAYVKPQL